MRNLLFVASLLTALAPLSVPSALAEHGTCPNTHDLRGVVFDSVTASDRDYWRLQIGPLGSTTLDGHSASGVLVVLVMVDSNPLADADLHVWKLDAFGNCQGPVCSSTNGPGVPDTCTVIGPGTFFVEPRYWFDGSDGKVQYALTAEAWPLAGSG